jgi:hypothetical protein
MLYRILALVKVDILTGLFITHGVIEQEIADIFLGLHGCRGNKEDLDPVAGGEKSELLASRNDLQLSVRSAGVIGKC